MGATTTTATATATTTTTTASAPSPDNPGVADADTGDTRPAPSAHPRLPVPSAHPRLPALDALHGPGTEEKVHRARVLAVGAGGVGCELLKNLASVGFGHVTVIDLDVVDFSNLNRQFLFRRHHVGKPKATEAAQSVRSMMPRSGTEINGVLHNIKDVRFDVDFFRSFTLVCNALDNLDARRHVNRMCLAADVALVDSGSTGYLGQCEVFGKGYECYDCIEHPPPKAYAVCTIRSTPEKPVHCVVWAKLLFDLVFGPPDADNVLSDLDGNAAAGEQEQEQDKGKEGEREGAEGKEEEERSGKEENGEKKKVENQADAEEKDVHDAQTNGSTTTAAAEQASTPAQKVAEKPDSSAAAAAPKKRIRLQVDDTAETFAQRLCQRVFVDDIEEQCRMESLWESRPPPIPQDVTKLSSAFTSSASSSSDPQQEQEQDETSSTQSVITTNPPPSSQPGLPEYATVDALGQAAWTAEQSAWMLRQSLLHMATKRRADIGDVKFDKDDRDALLFVTAASNLRAAAYGVTPLQSPFSVKGIAGNIVHAVATTNAMVAGLIALEAVRIAAHDGDVSSCKKTLVSKSVLGSRVCTVLQTDPMRRPRSGCGDSGSGCFVCGRRSVRLQVDVDAVTLGAFVDAVCRRRMSMQDPIVQASVADKHYTVYECGQGLDDEEVEEYAMKEKLSLRECHVTHAAILTVEDLRQNVACTMHVAHVPGLRAELAPAERFVIDGDVGGGQQQKKKEEEKEKEKEEKGREKKKVEEADDVDDITWVEEVDKTRPDWGKLEAQAVEREKNKKEEKEKEVGVVEVFDDVVVVATTDMDKDKKTKANTNGGNAVEVVDVDADVDMTGTGANNADDSSVEVVDVDADVDVEQTVASKKRRLGEGVNGQRQRQGQKEGKRENGGVVVVDLVDDDDDDDKVKEPETKRARTDES